MRLGKADVGEGTGIDDVEAPDTSWTPPPNGAPKWQYPSLPHAWSVAQSASPLQVQLPAEQVEFVVGHCADVEQGKVLPSVAIDRLCVQLFTTRTDRQTVVPLGSQSDVSSCWARTSPAGIASEAPIRAVITRSLLVTSVIAHASRPGGQGDGILAPHL